MRRIVLGPFNRVEGDLEVSLEVADGHVRSAQVTAPLYRGFENVLLGKTPLDALVFVPRICGICSVSQSAAAAAALRAAMGIVPAPNGELVSALVLAAENLADHVTQFYLFFMPDFAREAYRTQNWHAAARARFEAVKGSATAEVLPARAAFLELTGTLAGKWPHTLALQPGGSTRTVAKNDKLRLLALLRRFRLFLEQRLLGDSLEAFAALDSEAALWRWADARTAHEGDFRHFLHIARALSLASLGRAGDRFLSFGAYPLNGQALFASGTWQEGMATPLDPQAITEDGHHAWLRDDPDRHSPGAHPTGAHPFSARTEPVADKEGAYSWCKAPRLDGQTLECGALARQLIDGHPLVRDLVARGGGNVLSRVTARTLELARVLPAMEHWVQAIVPGEPFCMQGEMPEQTRGAGLVEAARGSLGHWLVVNKGVIANYQIIAPTTWNFSPRDGAGQPGALEQALAGTPVGEDERVPLAVQHIVRSFDPCMSCTVH